VGKRKINSDAVVLLNPVFLPKFEEHPNQALPDTQGCQALHPLEKAFFPQGKAPEGFLQKLGMLLKKEGNLSSLNKADTAVVDGLG